MAQQVLSATASNEALAPHVRLFTGGLSPSEAPKWYYQDLQGQLQGPFDANTMSRWCGENALPLDLKCLGVHPQDGNITPSSAALSHFQPLQKLLENTAAGIQYMPVRLGKGSLSDEGPATPQSAAPPKGSRAAVPGPPANHAQLPVGTIPISNGGPDVTRAVDQRGAPLPAAAGTGAVSGGMNGIPGGQQQQQPGSALLQHLQMAAQQQQPMQRPNSQQRQQSTPGRRPGQQGGGPPPNHFMHEQHAGLPQGAAGVGAFIPPPAPAKPSPEQQQDAASAGQPSELSPGAEAWEPALLKLLKREGFSGKEADVKWRVILVTGDRVGPFSTEQMLDWLLGNKPPKGISKQQATATAQNPPALQIAGILTSDYSAQRLPGAKFFKPLGVLLALIASGMQYQAVNKHDLQRGLPSKGWNESAAGSKPSPTTPALPPASGKGASKAAKAAAARGQNASASNSSNNSSGKGAQAQGNRSSSQLSSGGNRSRSSTPAGLPEAGDGPAAASTSSSKTSTFKHPMALRQQQRQQQQEALMAAGQAPAGQPGMPGGPGALPGLPGKGMPASNARMGPLAAASSASRSILTAANTMGAAGMQAGLQQQQFAGAAAMAAQQAAAGRFAQGLATPQQQQQQQLTPQQQMQAASLAFLQSQQGAAQQALWLKQQQQQLPGQQLAGVFPADQAMLGYAGMQGYPMAAAGPGGVAQMAPGDAAAAAAVGRMMQNAGLPRTSSTGSGAQQQQQQQQQPPPPSASHAPPPPQQQQQLLAAADGQGWQLQAQQAGKVRPPAGVPAFAMGQPGALPGQPGLSPSPQLMHAAALLFLHDQQQPPQQVKPDKPQTRWWVQRNERAFSGPFSGLQMYQAFLQPQGPLRLTEGTPIAAVASPPTALSGRDVPPGRAFAPLSCLLEAAAQGFVLVPWPMLAMAAGGRDSGPVALLVQQAATGATAPLQAVLSQAGLMALQQQQQQAAGMSSDGQPQPQQQPPEAGSSDQDAAVRMAHPGAPQQQMLAASKQRQPPPPQQQQPPQGPLMGAVRPAAGGFIQLPNGSIVPTAGLIPMQDGGLAMLQAAPAMAAPPPAPPTVDPLAVASALFTAGGNPNTIVWYLRTDGGPAGPEGPQSSITGPYDPQHMLDKYREGKLGPATMLCATHRGPPGQPLPPPPLDTFKPLHVLMHTVSTPSAEPHAQQQQQQQQQGPHPGALPPAGHLQVPGSAAQGANLLQHQMMPGGMILAQAPGSVGPMLFQVPASGAGPVAAVMGGPGSLQMQQLGQVQGLHQMGAPLVGGPYVQTPQGIVVQQHLMAALSAQQQHQAQQQQAQQHAQQQQQQQQQALAGAVSSAQVMQGPQASAAPADNGPCSNSSTTAVQPPAAAAAPAGPGTTAQQSSTAPGAADAAQRAGAAPPRVDTWGSLAAAQELLQRRPSASSSNGQQTPAAASNQSQMEAALAAAAAAAAANSRRASMEGQLHQHGAAAGMMLLPGGPMQHLHQQQHLGHHGHKAGGAPALHAGGFGGLQGHHAAQQAFGLSGPRSSSSSGVRGNAHLQQFDPDSAAAAAAAATALAGSLNLQGGTSPSFGLMQAQQQQLYMQAAMLSSMAPQSAAMQTLLQQQQQAAALVAASAAAPTPGAQLPQPPAPPSSGPAGPGGPAAASGPPSAPSPLPEAVSSS